MRTFKQFMRIRKIHNLKNWISGMRFKTDGQIAEWCISQDIEPPENNFFDKPHPAPVDVLLACTQEQKPKSRIKKTTKKTKTKPSPSKDPINEVEEQTIWIPAAERSRKVLGKKPIIKKQHPDIEDEESNKSNKESDTD